MSFEKNLFEEKKTNFLWILNGSWEKVQNEKKFREGQTDREKTDAGQKVIKKSLEFQLR